MQAVIHSHSLTGRGIRARTQGGIMVIAIMLILVAGSSYMLVKKFNANAQKARADVKTMEALKTAKQALIGYAVTYPDDPGLDGGPGYLPCPDTNNDGQPEGNCSDATGSTIGRLPHGYTRLGISDLRDGSGERLWYAISENYRYGPNKTIPLNSDTEGTLEVDNVNDIVAIVFAPREPVSGQNSRGSMAEDIEDYLEGENANLDQVFTRSGGVDFNDRLVIITRNELMTVVETRVLGDIYRSLQNYRTAAWNDTNAYPWLSPYSDPATSAFRGTVDTYTGHIPFHWSGDEPGSNQRNPFTSDITISWSNITSATISETLDTTEVITLPAPTDPCVENSQCTENSDPFDDVVDSVNSISGATCTWTEKTVFDCTGSFVVTTYDGYFGTRSDKYGYKDSYSRGWSWFYTNTSGSWDMEIAYIDSIGLGWGTWPVYPYMQGDISRLYEFDIIFTDSDIIDVNPPDGNNPRTRDLDTIASSFVSDDIQLTVTDTITNIEYYPNYEDAPSSKESSKSLVSNSGTVGTINSTGVHYDLDMDDNELPGWFVENDWHEMVYVAYPESEEYPGDDNTQCTPGTDCLKLSWIDDSGTRQLSDGVRALVMLSGREINDPGLGLVQERPSSDLEDYFEESDFGSTCGASSICNYDENTGFVSGRKSDNFNDLVRVLEPN